MNQVPSIAFAIPDHFKSHFSSTNLIYWTNEATLAPARIIEAVTAVINDIHSDEEIDIPLGVSRLGTQVQMKEARLARQRRSQTGRQDSDKSPIHAPRIKTREADSADKHISKRRRMTSSSYSSDSGEEVDYNSSMSASRCSSLQSSSSSAQSVSDKTPCGKCEVLINLNANFCQNCGATTKGSNLNYSSDNWSILLRPNIIICNVMFPVMQVVFVANNFFN